MLKLSNELLKILSNEQMWKKDRKDCGQQMNGNDYERLYQTLKDLYNSIEKVRIARLKHGKSKS